MKKREPPLERLLRASPKTGLTRLKSWVRNTFFPSKECQTLFFDSIARKNSHKINIFAIITIIIQSYNIHRVLALSNAKLSTFNNRVYFSFYVALLLFCVAVLVMRQLCKNNNSALTRLVHFSCTFWITWMTLLNAYDIVSKNNTDTGTYVTAVVCLMLIQMSPRRLLCMQLTSYIVFVGLIHNSWSQVVLTNVTLAVVMTFLCAVVQYTHTISEISYTINIEKIRQQLEQESASLRSSLEKLDFILTESKLGLFEWNLATDLLVFSENCVEELGCPIEVSCAMEWVITESQIHPDDREWVMQGMKAATQHHRKAELEFRWRNRNGAYTWYLAKITPQYCDDKLTGLLGVFYNIDRQRRHIVELQNKVETDSLTNALNAEALKTKVEHYIATAQNKQSIAMLIIDVDDFKSINDRYGHPFGDKVLVELARVMAKDVRSSDLLARIGGDEFCAILVCDHAWEHGAIDKKIDQLRHDIKSIRFAQHDAVTISCSIGAYAVPAKAATYESLYVNADKELYAAKHQGKDCYSIRDDINSSPVTAR